MYKITSIIFLIITFSLEAQVGVGTTTPHPDVMMDVNGKLRVRDYTLGTSDAARDSIMVLDGRGVIYRIPSSQVLANMNRSLIKGNFASSGITIAALSYLPLRFDSEAFDIKNEYDTATHYFTAQSDGIYKIYTQIKTGSVSIGDLGLGIFKTDLSNTESLIAQERFINVSVIGVNVSPPTRKVSTMVQLQAGERIRFKLYSAVSISVSSNDYDSYFTIEQVR